MLICKKLIIFSNRVKKISPPLTPGLSNVFENHLNTPKVNDSKKGLRVFTQREGLNNINFGKDVPFKISYIYRISRKKKFLK